MADRETLDLNLNNNEIEVDAAAGATLLTVLRDELRILSAKRGCNQGVCGSCTVLIDGYPQRACLTLAASCEGKTVQTVDGLTGDAAMTALQNQFRACGAVQCGFCTGGMLVSAWHLLQENPAPSREDINAGLSGNLCRCTGYQKIVDSVSAAAREASS
jgi:carbon-monoxide dehydrogenase small subunit